jgi:RNA polymerase sigma-70 factor (ECF subfamily)
MRHAADDSSETLRLVDLARDGDAAAFSALFARHRDRLRGFIDNRLDHRLRTRLDSSDVVQDTHVEAFRRFRDYCQRRPMPFHIWLRKTAYDRLLNLYRDHLQAQRRSVQREVRMSDQSSILIAATLRATQVPPSEVAARREEVEQLSRVIDLLPEMDREVLLMRNVEGMSHIEIAHLLEIDHATARKRYARALVRLEKLLVEHGMAGPQR